MIDETHLQRLKLSRLPFGQKVVANLLLGPNFNIPPFTRVVIEGTENLPRDRTVMFAMNHTDRYNYWPFQYGMYRRHLPFSTTWVKGKYYENKALSWFFDQCNNIPLPSRGYLILQDARAVLNAKLDDADYRILRDLVDDKRRQSDITPSTELRRILEEPRRDFKPEQESYADFIHRWNDRLMALVEQRTLEALFKNENNVIVFPQGTRSIRLLPGKPGMAQFALRHRVPIVPVGSMGSEEVYPGANPWAGGGTCRYVIGRPLTMESDFADCQINDPYTPFTREAEKYSACFTRAMERVTNAINDLLEEPYKLADTDDVDETPRAERLI